MSNFSSQDVVLICKAVTWIYSFLQSPLKKQFSVAPEVEEPLKNYLSESGKENSQTIKPEIFLKLHITRVKQVFEQLMPHSSIVNVVYQVSLKTGSLDNAIQEFSLAWPSWYMSHYTMIYKKW